ncbi:small subunit ribosomal protein S33, partial [Lecanoromycetidae sp. Uapishka_2]
MSVPQSRIFDLLKVQCRIFSQTYNPLRLRTGNRVLRQRLRGPSVAAYYPRRVATLKDLKNAYKHFDEEMETWDDDEEDRLEHIALAKQRGKGAPKKKRTADGK